MKSFLYLKHGLVRQAESPHSRIFFFSLLFALTIHLTHARYLFREHAYLGFPFVPIGVNEWVFIATSIFLVSRLLPLNLMRPSAVIAFILYMLVYLPTQVITMAVAENALEKYGLNLCAMTAGFLFLLFTTGGLAKDSDHKQISLRKCSIFLIFAALLCAAFLAYAFHDAMNIVGLSGTYEQREAGRSRNLLEGYGQTYLAFVLAPALLAVGLIRKSLLCMGLALACFFLVYSITAERTVFMLPLVMVVGFFLLRSRLPHSILMLTALAAVTLLFLLSVYFRDTSKLAGMSTLYLVFRTFSVPGAMFWQYQEVFSEYGYTLWSHVRGISYVIPVPVAFDSDSDWPQLGRIVANHLLSLDINSNANPFAYDGVAGGGIWGVLLVSGLLTAWLAALDHLSRGFDPYFPVLISIPLGMVLANGPFFTALTSFGGLFWLLFFFFARYAQSSGR
jgi:hypothetical protein